MKNKYKKKTYPREPSITECSRCHGNMIKSKILKLWVCQRCGNAKREAEYMKAPEEILKKALADQIERKNYFAALYTQPIKIGDKNPPGEAEYVGYSRVMFFARDTNEDEIIFPMAQESYDRKITHLAALDMNGVVVTANIIKDRSNIHFISDSLYDIKCTDQEEKLKPLLTEDFLNTLVEAIQVSGWTLDFTETTEFARWCFNLAGKKCPPLTHYDYEKGEE